MKLLITIKNPQKSKTNVFQRLEMSDMIAMMSEMNDVREGAVDRCWKKTTNHHLLAFHNAIPIQRPRF